jgi:hypothetical protein
MNLHKVWPSPWPVEIRGRSYLVSEYRLRDLACLGDWVARQRGNPLDRLPPSELRSADPRAWRAALLAAHELADADAPEWGDPEAAPLVQSFDGLAFSAWVAIRRHQPEVDLSLATRLTAAMLNEAIPEWVALQIAALRPDARYAVNRIVLADVAPHLLAKKPRRGNWARSVADLILNSSMTLNDISELTVGQFNLIVSRGEPDDGCSFDRGREGDLPGRLARWWAMDGGDGANGDGHA